MAIVHEIFRSPFNLGWANAGSADAHYADPLNMFFTMMQSALLTCNSTFPKNKKGVSHSGEVALRLGGRFSMDAGP